MTGHSIGRLAEPVTGHVLTRGVVLVGPVHGLGLDPRHDGMALELPHLLPQISVGLLRVLIRVEGDVPGIVQRTLAGCNLWTIGSRKQILK